MKILPIILCGGSGTRLWPVSRTFEPKQLQPLVTDSSMVVETAKRMVTHKDCLPTTIISGAAYADTIAEQFELAGLPIDSVLIEPEGRDTAAAAGIAALWAEKRARDLGEQIVVLLLPSDHFIGNLHAFHEAIGEAGKAAIQGFIATLSIYPDAPETGFGYIKRVSEPLPGLASHKVERFVEKPDLQTAEQYLADGNYSWNSGMFAFLPETLLSELASHEPAIFESTRLAFTLSEAEHRADTKHFPLNQDAFSRIPKKSLDYAVMERTDKACTCPVDIDWSDVGSWHAIYDISQKQSDENVISGQVIPFNTKNCLVRNMSDRLITTLGLENLAIIDTGDALLIADIDQTQDVKKIHTALVEQSLPQAVRYSTNTSLGLRQAKTWAEDWLVNKALPLWSEIGIDRKYGGCHEKLALDGGPILDSPKRVRVQARQTFVFAKAVMMGHEQYLDSMRVPLDFMLEHAYLGKGRLVHLLNRNGSVLDGRHDTYDLAFFLYGLAHACKVSDNPKYRDIAETSIEVLLTEFRHPSGGFLEELGGPTTGNRRANPHMHLLEAALAWTDLHEHSAMSGLADEIVDLFNNNFFLDGLLREYFTERLGPLNGAAPPSEYWIEPGHLCEWAFLLQRYEQVRGRKSKPLAAMTSFVEEYGKSELTGLLYNHVSEAGEVCASASSRLWPQTEYVRLCLSSSSERKQKQGLDHLEKVRSIFLSPEGQENGRWIDCVDGYGEKTDTNAPASSFYHLMTMIDPLLS